MNTIRYFRRVPRKIKKKRVTRVSPIEAAFFLDQPIDVFLFNKDNYCPKVETKVYELDDNVQRMLEKDTIYMTHFSDMIERGIEAYAMLK